MVLWSFWCVFLQVSALVSVGPDLATVHHHQPPVFSSGGHKLRPQLLSIDSSEFLDHLDVKETNTAGSSPLVLCSKNRIHLDQGLKLSLSLSLLENFWVVGGLTPALWWVIPHLLVPLWVYVNQALASIFGWSPFDSLFIFFMWNIFVFS